LVVVVVVVITAECSSNNLLLLNQFQVELLMFTLECWLLFKKRKSIDYFREVFEIYKILRFFFSFSNKNKKETK
jgi:hypothetical protein